MRRSLLKPSRLPIGARSKGRDPRRYADSALKKKVLARDGWECVYCHRPVIMETGVADHVLSWNRGGPTTLRNLVSACANCNRLRGNKSVEEFRALYQSRQGASRQGFPPLT